MQHCRYAIFQLNPNLACKNFNLMVPAPFEPRSCWRRHQFPAFRTRIQIASRHVFGRVRCQKGLQTRSRTMKMKHFLVGLLLVPLLAISATAQARTHQTYGSEEGREVAAPSWSAACMTDHGPSQCGEPMWVYGSPQAVSRYRVSSDFDCRIE